MRYGSIAKWDLHATVGKVNTVALHAAAHPGKPLRQNTLSQSLTCLITPTRRANRSGTCSSSPRNCDANSHKTNGLLTTCQQQMPHSLASTGAPRV